MERYLDKSILPLDSQHDFNLKYLISAMDALLWYVVSFFYTYKLTIGVATFLETIKKLKTIFKK